MGNSATKHQCKDKIDTFTINADQAKQITKEASWRLQANQDVEKARKKTAAAERHQAAIRYAKEEAEPIIVRILHNIKTEASLGNRGCSYWTYANGKWNDAREREYMHDELVRAIKALGFDVIVIIDDKGINAKISWE